MASDEWLSGAECVQSPFDDTHCFLYLVRRYGHFLTLIIFLGLDAEGKSGATDDIDAALESFTRGIDCQSAEGHDANEKDGSHVALASLDLGGEIPEEQDEQSNAC